MKEYSITEQFALVALDGQNSEHNTVAKKVAVRGIAMAEVLQKICSEISKEHISEASSFLNTRIQEIQKMKKNERNQKEQEITRVLMEENVLFKIPDLLGCDMDFQTSGVNMWQYKCDEEEYLRITESVRAEILEPGDVSAETIWLLYLFRECGCMHDIFCIKEQEFIKQRLIELMAKEPLYKIILETEFHSGAGNAYVLFVKKKHRLFQNPYLQGVNLAFPFFDRRQAIFIDMITLGTTPADRRRAVMQILREKGHCCEEVLRGEEYLLKIDNSYYKVWPYARKYQVSVQGVELRPVYQ